MAGLAVTEPALNSIDALFEMRPGPGAYHRHHHRAAVVIGAIVLLAQPNPSSSFAPSTHAEHVAPARQLDATPTSSIDVSIIDGPFSREVFASTGCWGRRPVLIRNAFDADTLLSQCDDEGQVESSMWPSWDDVALLSCDEDGESRLITHRPGDPHSWELQIGPFEDEDVANILGDKADQEVGREDDDDKWTLVVNDVDRFFPSLADWVAQEYTFIPRWRRDDAQISLSDAGGGIGAHVDNYDVFLVQMNGRRTWEVGKRFVSEQEECDTLVDGIDVRVLSTWEEDRQRGYVEVFELDPGDVLYLPPRMPHCGVALTDGCMTLSVGLRAPSANDMMSRLAELMTSSVAGKAIERVTDEDLLEDNDAEENGNPNANSGEITGVAKDRARHLIKAALEEYIDDDDKWDKIFGQLVTVSKRPRINYPVPLVDGDEEELGLWGNPKKAVVAMLEGKGALYQAEGITFGYSILDESSAQGDDEMQNDGSFARLFVNGEAWSLGRSKKEKEVADVKLFLQTITSKRRLDWHLFDTHAMAGRSSKHIDNEEGGKASNSRPLHALSKQMIDLLEDLVQKGYLYGGDD